MPTIDPLSAATIARGSMPMRRAARSILGILKGMKLAPRRIDASYTQQRLASIIGHILTICGLTGETPAECMRRIHVPPVWRFHVWRVKGPAGDKLRAAQQAKKKFTRANRNHPDKVARRAREAASFERYLTEAQELIDLGMDEREAVEAARAAMTARDALLTRPLDAASDGPGIAMEAVNETEQGSVQQNDA